MKNFRSPYFSLIMAFSIFFASCSTGEITTEEVNQQDATMSRTSAETLTATKALWADAERNYGSAGFTPTDDMFLTVDNDFDTNWTKAVGTGLVSSSDRLMFEKLANEIVSKGFTTAINSFESSYIAKGYTGTKLSVYQNFVKVLKDKNTQDPSFFARNNFDCGLAVVGFGIAFASLATLTAASGGLTIGLTVVGYQVAAVGLVRACR